MPFLPRLLEVAPGDYLDLLRDAYEPPVLLEVAPGDYLNLLRDAYEPPVEAQRKNGRLEQSLWCLEEIKLIPLADLMDLIAATISPYSLLTQVPSLFLVGWEWGIV